MKEPSYYLDFIRVLACLMVIAMHSPIPHTSAAENPLSGLLSYFTAPCIGLFFMVSGALLLPISVETSEFLRKRLKKVFLPTLFWSLFYIVCNVYKGNLDLSGMVVSLLGIPFSAQGNGVLWFMYTMIGLYLLAPIISDWLHKASRKNIEFYLFLWSISLCLPFFRLFLNISYGEENILYNFSGYSGYFLLGFYLNKYVLNPIGRKSCLYWILGVMIVLLPPAACKVFHLNIDFYSLFWYLSVGVALMCVGWFLLIKNISLLSRTNTLTIALAEISKMSFGIYLVHIFIMRDLLWNLSFLQHLPFHYQIPLCTILTFGLSYLFVKLFSKFSFSKHIIGC